MRVGAIQLNSGPDKEANLTRIGDLLERAAAAGCALAALPELANARGKHATAQAEPIPGPTTRFLGDQARRHRMWVLGGSQLERPPDGSADQRAFNTSVLLDPHGKITATYRKIHLFDVAIAGGPTQHESARVAAGTQAVTARVGAVTVGLSICYDVRFPELYRLLALRGAQILFIPAAFTAFTGRDHWEVLLRARAIENQAFVVAPAQVGASDGAGDCYGHSMIIDPWGRVLTEAPDQETVAIADLDLAIADRVRAELPSLANRMPHAYAGIESRAPAEGVAPIDPQVQAAG